MLGSRLMMMCVCLSASPSAADEPPPFRHAYFLFESAGPEEASTSYIPLLVTRVPIESEGEVEAAVITTYERNAIWLLESRTSSIPPETVDGKVRKIRFRDKSYRYQAAAKEEVVGLLEDPEGEVLLHRLEPPISRDATAFRDLLLRDLGLAPAEDSPKEAE